MRENSDLTGRNKVARKYSTVGGASECASEDLGLVPFFFDGSGI
jgi:hypothetical protein